MHIRPRINYGRDSTGLVSDLRDDKRDGIRMKGEVFEADLFKQSVQMR